MTILADPPVAPTVPAVSVEVPVERAARPRIATPIETQDCECPNFFGRLMMWATRNAPR